MGLMRDFCEYCGRLELMLARTRERYWIGCWHVGKIFAIGCDSCTVQHCSESVYRYSGTTRGSWQCDGLVKTLHLGSRLQLPGNTENGTNHGDFDSPPTYTRSGTAMDTEMRL